MGFWFDCCCGGLPIYISNVSSWFQLVTDANEYQILSFAVAAAHFQNHHHCHFQIDCQSRRRYHHRLRWSAVGVSNDDGIRVFRHLLRHELFSERSFRDCAVYNQIYQHYYLSLHL